MTTITTGATPHISNPAPKINQSAPTDTSYGDSP